MLHVSLLSSKIVLVQVNAVLVLVKAVLVQIKMADVLTDKYFSGVNHIQSVINPRRTCTAGLQ